ncbi:thiamine phosphate synthase [Shewanella donghaensis]|uniref:thiamine phosphate synthase n=1 Tax=Shewanella donghaensis TaxID=238836 RepID=UPI0011836578|nr:thiamine phosphate synthase [Shewanella donghaensis]
MPVSDQQRSETTAPIVWTIAGSDSGGGAGIQTDLATINDLQCFGCSVITTLTAQNSVVVSLVETVSESMLLAQLDALADDLAPSAIKIGLIANQKQLVTIAYWLKRFKSQTLANQLIPVILDPVMVASSGDCLNDQTKTQLDFTPFKGLISLITPNVVELFKLTVSSDMPIHHDSVKKKLAINSERDFYRAAMQLVNKLHCHVLAKGGDASHWQESKANDLYICRKVNGVSEAHQYQSYWLKSNRVETINNHGTGCTLSSAIACFLAQNYVLHDAIVMAKAYVLKGLIQSVSYGKGAGPVAKTAWPDDLHYYPEVVTYYAAKPQMSSKNLAKVISKKSSTIDNNLDGHKPHENTAQGYSSSGFPALQKDIGVYPVVDDVAMLQTLLEANCTTIQLRVKKDQSHAFVLDNLNGCSKLDKLEQDIAQAIALGKQYNAQVFINDHWEIALKLGAFGIHLGQEDVELADLKAISAAGIALGLSSHSIFEILLAHQLNPSYIALGHIFPTTTKVMPSKPQGLSKLSRYSKLLNNVYPTVAIGGIDSTVLDEIKATGVNSVAVVRAITHAKEPALAFTALLQQWTLGLGSTSKLASKKPLQLSQLVETQV